MNQTQKAEQLRLPEQLYILLMDPETGEPRFGSERVRRVLAVAVVWELLDSGAVKIDNGSVSEVRHVAFPESYLRRAALAAADSVGITGQHLIMRMMSDLHPIWGVIGQDMVNEHLLTSEVRTRFCFFHQRVLRELGDARDDGFELKENLRAAARRIWDDQYDDELAKSHPRMLARIVLLDNYGLLERILGSEAYDRAAQHIPGLRSHLHTQIQQAVVAPHRASSSDSFDYSSSSDGGIYSSGTDFWIYDTAGSHASGSDGHHHGGYGDAGAGSDSHSGHSHGHDSDSGGHGGHDSGSDCGGGDSGGDSGGCGGCGGCGG